MHEKMLIRDFGPIRNADIALQDITVLVGPQATGKSLVAQLLYFMRGLEEFPEFYTTNEQANNLVLPSSLAQRIHDSLTHWLGNNAIQYGHKNTRIDWQPESMQECQELILSQHPLQEPKENISLNAALTARLQRMHAPMATNGKGRQIYIPAGRILYSFLSPALGMYLQGGEMTQWPGFINLFYQKLSESMQRLSAANLRRVQYSDRASMLELALEEKMQRLFQGKLLFSDPNRIMLVVEDAIAREEGYSRSFAFDARMLSAGQMEAWPFWAIVQDALLRKDTAPTVIFLEEPESHLHPTAQVRLMETIAWLTKQNMRFVITTHSPYVIYSLNNFLKAKQVLDSGKALPVEMTAAYALSANQVNAYRFDQQGQVHSMMDKDIGLLQSDELDDPADDLGALFAKLDEAM